MVNDKGASVRQRRVSAELRALRMERGLTCQDVADALDCSVSKISRMETGVRGLYVDEVAAILGFLRATSKQRKELLDLVRDGEKPNWIQVGSGLPRMWKDLIRIENDASVIYSYEPLVVPGLLQTGDYAREVIRAGNPDYAEGALDHLVRTRMGRQAILSRFNGPTLHVLLDEMVLRRPVGEPGVMSGQLQYLVHMASRSRIELAVVPFVAGAHPGMEGPVLLMEFLDQPTLAHVEVRGASGFLEETPQIAEVRLAWRGLRSMALSPDDSVRLIAEIAGEMT